MSSLHCYLHSTQINDLILVDNFSFDTNAIMMRVLLQQIDPLAYNCIYLISKPSSVHFARFENAITTSRMAVQAHATAINALLS